MNARVVVLSRDPAKFQATYPELRDAPEIEWIQGDVRNFNNVGLCDFAIHAATDVVATSTPSVIFDTCVRGTSQVLLHVRDGGRALLVSSGAVYGQTPTSIERISENYFGVLDPLKLTSVYGEGKRASELLCSIVAAERGLQIPVARCFAFVGPHLQLDKHFAIGNFIAAAMHGKALNVSGDGTPLRSYLYAADLACWLWIILFDGQSLRAYNVGGQEAVSIEQLANRVVAALGPKSKVLVAQMAQPGAPMQKYIPDISRSVTELGLKVEINLDEAILRTANWHKKT